MNVKDLLIKIEEDAHDMGVCSTQALYLSFDMDQAEVAKNWLVKNRYESVGMKPLKIGIFELPYTDPLVDIFAKKIDEAEVIDVTDISLLDSNGESALKETQGMYMVTTINGQGVWVEAMVYEDDTRCSYRSWEVLASSTLVTWNELFHDAIPTDESPYEEAAEGMDNDD